MTIIFGDFYRLIFGASIDKNMLNAFIGLMFDAVQACFDGISAIETGGDYSDFHSLRKGAKTQRSELARLCLMREIFMVRAKALRRKETNWRDCVL